MYYNYNSISHFTPDETDKTGEKAKQTQHVQRSQVSTILCLLQSACLGKLLNPKLEDIFNTASPNIIVLFLMLALFCFAQRNKIALQNQNLPGSKVLDYILVTNCVSFLFNSLELFLLNNPSSAFFGKYIKLLQIWWTFVFGSPRRFSGQSFEQGSQLHSLHQEQRPRHRFVGDCLRFSFKIFSFFMIPSTLTRVQGTDTRKHPHSIILPPLHFTSCYMPLPSFSKHLQGQTAIVLSYVIKWRASSMCNLSPGCPSYFSLAWMCLFFRSWVFLVLEPSVHPV